ncbi:MAG: hypothetical protein AAGE61_09700 [Pseudomonadota bacterium]
MPLFHVSISANDPEGVAAFLAEVMGGQSLPFPPFPDCWIAFSAEDDGTAIEVYPTTHVLKAGAAQVACNIEEPTTAPTFVHVALASVLPRETLLSMASRKGWSAQTCNRGPFECVEIWIEDRLLIEALDDAMQLNYRTRMNVANWAEMFGLSM